MKKKFTGVNPDTTIGIKFKVEDGVVNEMGFSRYTK